MSDTLVLRCDNCGAPLPVPAGVHYITCTYCGSTLLIHRDDGVAYTEVLEKLDRRTERLAGEIELVRLHQALDDLDRSWDKELESYKIYDGKGRGRLPTEENAVMQALPFFLFGVWIFGTWIVLFVGGAHFGVISFLYGVVGLGVIGGGVYMLFRNFNKVHIYQKSVSHYHAERDKLRLQIADVEERIDTERNKD